MHAQSCVHVVWGMSALRLMMAAHTSQWRMEMENVYVPASIMTHLDASKSVHRTTAEKVGIEKSFPMQITTDVGNAKPARMKTMSLQHPVHAVYVQPDSKHCIIIVMGDAS